MAALHIRQGRLASRQQGRLIESFAAVSTAHATAEIFGVQPKTAVRFFTGRRQLIASKLPSYRLCGEMEADDSGLRWTHRSKGSRSPWQGGCVRVSEAGQQGVYVHHSQCLHRDDRAPWKREWNLTALSIPTRSRLITPGISRLFITIASTLQNSWPKTAIMSTGLRISGTSSNGLGANTTESSRTISVLPPSFPGSSRACISLLAFVSKNHWTHQQEPKTKKECHEQRPIPNRTVQCRIKRFGNLAVDCSRPI